MSCLLDDSRDYDVSAWKDKGHTVTLLTPDPNDHSTDMLFVDHHIIYASNWSWDQDEAIITWKQEGEGEETLAGHITFREDGLEGAGSIVFGETRATTSLSYIRPTYTCDLSTNAGAYVEKQGTGYAVRWNTDSKE